MQIKYSEKIKGNEQNYNWQVRFDLDSGFLGISQYHEDGKIERVLLSPEQKKALLEFCGLTQRAPDARKSVLKKVLSNKKGSVKPAHG